MKINLQQRAGYLLLLLGTLYIHAAKAQTATKSYPFAIGRNSSCGSSGSHEVHYYTYNSSTNSITNASGGKVAPCVPQLRIGGTSGSTQRFTSTYASISYNPADHNIYYLWTATSSFSGSGTVPRTYVWRWPAGSCAGTTSNKLDTLCSFPYDLLGVAFDNNGNGFVIDFTTTTPIKPLIRSIDFTTRTLGPADNLALTSGATVYQTGSGDVAMTPSGQMFFVVDNKLFTPDYRSYTGTGANITCTYIDTVKLSGNFVGLTYADGETIAAFSGGGCPYYEINPLTAITANITKSGTVYSASDMATVVSGIGAAKKLISATPTGTANQYDVVYDIYVQNYGNMDITNVQVTDDFTAINGAANVTNVTTSFMGATPAGITLNSSFNGNSNKNLLTGTGTLPNYPVANNHFTIRISCRLSNIQQGKLYLNSATATAKDFNNNTLTDISTNGSKPDLNSNDKPDDAGEDQPTPLLIAVTAQTPPCGTLGQVFYTENFGTGGMATTLLSGTTQYTGSATQPLAIDRYMLASNANMGDNAKFISLTDHTNGAGRMMIVNADATAKIFYSGEVNSLCVNQQYSLSFYAAFVGNNNYQTICDGFGGFKYPKVKMRVKDKVSGAIITEIATGDITSTSWNLYGMKWVMPAGFSNIVFELINDGEGGCGNDIAIDDIQFGTCDPAPMVSVSGPSVGCLESGTTISANLSDASSIPGVKEYQWQISTDNIAFTDIAGATSATYTIANVTASDVNKYYRVLVAAAGNMGSASCRYTSAGYMLTAKNPSAAPTSISKNRTVICAGNAIVLKANGGMLGTNAVYKWYSGSCGGTYLGTGPTITVTPAVPTTYFVRIEGDCNVTTCVSISITFNCDIDADDDGITDNAESGGVDPKLDHDLDGVPDWKDAQYPGFIDVNGDGVNDQFDSDLDGVPNFLDRDSDNDGIPDVVEADGADANGDGIIDGFTDIDNDGLSDNVDADLSGAAGSGQGLGLPDLDGDSIPNYIDLDSDNDGIPDVVEVYGIDANNDGMLDFAGSFFANDTDGDGLLNAVDGDANGDGSIENTNGPLLKTGAVLANGRAANYPNKNMDGDSNPNPYDLDSDGDGITDVVEAGFTDANYNGQIDGAINARGWNTAISSQSKLILPNRDGTGRPNVYDIDSDDDGIPDNIEGQTTAGYKLPLNTDTDSDGIDDAYDNVNGFGGKGINPVNTDGDAFPDYIDFDTDGDGLEDIFEGNDLNLNKKTDDEVTPTGIDTDDDGLDDRFDADNNSSTGTSKYMGNGGSINGPFNSGSYTVVQKSVITAFDRDWRFMDYVLAAYPIQLKAKQVNQTVALQYTIPQPGFEKLVLERSTNGVTFRPLQTIAPSLAGQVQDDIATLSNPILYYRIKGFDQSGRYKISNMERIAISSYNAGQLTIYPNPVKDILQIGVNSSRGGMATFTIWNAKGQAVISFTHMVQKGYTVVAYTPHTINLANGFYFVHMQLDDLLYSARFEVHR